MTKETLDAIVNNAEFSECINGAAPHRVKIMQDLTPQMKEVQDDFLQTMIAADWNGIKSTMDKLKLDKKDESAKEEYAVWKKKTMNIFRSTLKTIHPNENQVPSIGMLYVAGSMLEYIDKGDLITGNENYDKSNPLTFKKLESINAFFNDANVKAKMQQIFMDADEIQGEMCENNDEIKKTWYEKLPASVKFDKDVNKKGLKENHFQALVRHKAVGMIKDKEAYTKYINNQIDNSDNNIDREEVILGKIQSF